MKLYEYCSQVAAKNDTSINSLRSLFSYFAGLKRQMKGHVIDAVFAYGNTKPNEFYNLVVSFKDGLYPSVKFIKISITANFGGFSANLENYEGFSRTEAMEILSILVDHLAKDVE
jgi:hypothetical protein